MSENDCVCYKCVKRYKETGEEIDCGCEGSSDVFIDQRCNNCDVKEYCDIYLHPELYKGVIYDIQTRRYNEM